MLTDPGPALCSRRTSFAQKRRASRAATCFSIIPPPNPLTSPRRPSSHPTMSSDAHSSQPPSSIAIEAKVTSKLVTTAVISQPAPPYEGRQVVAALPASREGSLAPTECRSGCVYFACLSTLHPAAATLKLGTADHSSFLPALERPSSPRPTTCPRLFDGTLFWPSSALPRCALHSFEPRACPFVGLGR